MLSSFSKVAKGGGWVAISVASAAILQLLQLSVLARAYSPAEMGVVAIATLSIAFCEILMSLGVSNSIIQRADVSHQEISSLFWLNLFVGVIVGALSLIASPLVAVAFGMSEYWYVLAMLCPALVIASMSQVPRGVLERGLSFGPVVASEMTLGLVSFAVVSCLALIGVGPLSISLGYLGGVVFRTMILFWAVRMEIRLSRHFRFGETRRFLNFGVYQSLDALVAFFSANAGSLVTGRFLSPAALGGYNIASTYAVNTPLRVNTVVTRVGFPALAGVVRTGGAVDRAVLRLFHLVGLLNAPLLLGLAALSAPFVSLVLGSSWLWIVPTLQILCLVGITRAWGNPMGVIMMVHDRMRPWFYINLVRAVVIMAASIAGASLAGTEGVALGLLFVGVAGSCMHIFLIRALTRVPWFALLSAHLKPIVLAVPGTVVAYVVSEILLRPYAAIVQVLVGALVGASIYVGMLFIADRAMFGQVFRAIVRRPR